MQRMSMDPQAPMDRGLHDAMEILREAERIGDPSLLAHAQEEAGWFLVWSGRSGDAEELLEEGIRQARARGASENEVMRLYRPLAATAIWGPLEVKRGLERWRGIAEEATGMSEGTALGVVGTLHGMLGEFEVARSYLSKGEAILRDLGAVLYLAAAHPPALVEDLAGNHEAAEALMRAGIETFQAVGETGFLSTCAVILGEALYAQGRLDEALEASRLGEAHTASGDVSSEMGWRSVQAKVLARLGQVEEAKRLAREAVSIAEKTDNPNDRGQCFMALAEVLRVEGQTEEAVRAAQEALRSYERKGNVVSAGRARTMIEELGG